MHWMSNSNGEMQVKAQYYVKDITDKFWKDYSEDIYRSFI